MLFQMLPQPGTAPLRPRGSPVVARRACPLPAGSRPPAAPPLARPLLRVEGDLVSARLARLVAQRASPRDEVADHRPSGLVVARMPLPQAIRLPGPMLLREDDDDLVEQEPEGWGEWALRQAKNPWVWAGVGLGIGVAGLVYYNRDSITKAVTGEALKHPDLLAKGAEFMGPEWVADKAGNYISNTLKEMAESSSISTLSPTEHLLDVKDALMKTIPGGGMVNMGLKVAQQVADNQQLVSTGLEVARQLGPGFVGEVIKTVAVNHGGDIVLSGVQIATEPMFESAGWVYNKIGSNHW